MRNVIWLLNFIMDYFYVPLIFLASTFAASLLAFVLPAIIPYLIVQGIKGWYNRHHPETAISESRLTLFLNRHAIISYATIVTALFVLRSVILKTAW